MKKIILLLILIANSALFAQTAKKEILLDENSKQITAVEFKNYVYSLDHKFTYIKFENDTAVFGKLIERKVYGVLKESDRLKVIDELVKLTGRDIEKNQTIIINYYYVEEIQNQRPCIDHYTSDRAYKKYIKKQKDVSQFFITTQDYIYDKKDVYEDKDYVIGSILFPFEIDCGNYIIIKPNGHFYRQVSEYRQDDIPKIVEAEW